MAADQGGSSNAERAQALKDTYGFTLYGAFVGSPYENKKPIDPKTEAQALTAIEDAFALMGTATTKKIYKPYVNFPKDVHHEEFILFIYNFEVEWGGGTNGQMNSPNSYHAGLHSPCNALQPGNSGNSGA